MRVSIQRNAGFLLAGLLLFAAPVAAQSTASPDGYKNASRLGGSTSFNRPPLTTHATLKRMVQKKVCRTTFGKC